MLLFTKKVLLVLVIFIPLRWWPHWFFVSWCSPTTGRYLLWVNLYIIIPSLKPISTMSCLLLGAVNPLHLTLTWALVFQKVSLYLEHIMVHLLNFQTLGCLSCALFHLPTNLWLPYVSHWACQSILGSCLSLWESPSLPCPQCHVWEGPNLYGLPLCRSPTFPSTWCGWDPCDGRSESLWTHT